MVNSIDWTLFGTLNKVPQLTVHVRGKKPSHEIEGIVCGAPRRDCVEAQIWGKVLKHFCSIEVPQEYIMLKWKKFGTTKTLPRAGHPAKLSNRENDLGQGDDQDPVGH